ncbi:MAG: DUF7344 domain-containing protein [Halodesulfurarchaeum sp.]
MHGQVTLPETEIYHVLSNPRRREVLSLLWERNEPLTLREVSEEIAATEAGVRPAPRALKESVYNALHQTHLPKLHALGLVRYDPHRKVIETTAEAGQVARYMDFTMGIGITWGEYYRALGILGLFVIVGALVEVPILSIIDPLLSSTIFLLLFALSTGYQLATNTIGWRGRLGRFSRRWVPTIAQQFRRW